MALIKLSQEDKLRLGEELAQLEGELECEVEFKKQAADGFNERIKGIEERISKIAATLRSGEAQEE